MINLCKFFIKNSILLIVITLIFTIWGIAAFANLNRNEDPGFKIRTATVSTSAEGYGANSVDKYISRPIEYNLLSMEEIEDIVEKSFMEKSVVYAHLYENVSDLQPIWDRLRRKTELSKNDIPSGLNPVVNDEFGDVFGALIGVSKEGADYEELYDYSRKIKDELLKLKTRGKVEIFGLQKEVLYVYFKNPLFTNLKLTPDYLQNYINSVNLIKNHAFLETNSNIIPVDIKSDIKSVDDIKNIPLDLNSRPVNMGDIFDIQKTTQKPKKTTTRINGKDALIVGISLQKDGNILNWGKEIKRNVKRLKEKFPEVNIDIVALQSEYVKKLTDKFTSSLYESIVAVILIVMVILNLKIGLITGGIILVTVCSVFVVMNILNIGLDKISLSALIISLGILVDNSIVVAQGCLRSFDKTNFKERIINVAQKFQTPLFVVSLTTSLSFLPVFIAKSTVSEYTSSLFKVVFITLAFSWFYSVTLLPFLIYVFDKDNTENKKELFLTTFLKNKIEHFLNHPKTVIISGISAFLVSLILFSFVPKIFFPDSDRNMFEIKLSLKNGVSFEETDSAVKKAENYLQSMKDVVNFASFIGTSAPRYVLSASPDADCVENAVIIVSVKNSKTVPNNINEVKKFIDKNIPNTQGVVRKIPLGPPVDAPIEIRIINNNIDLLFKYADVVSSELAKEKGIYLVKNNWGDLIPEYKARVNNRLAIMAGVRPDFLYDFLNTCLNGKVLTYYYRDDLKIPVILKGQEDKNLDLKRLSFYSKEKNSVIPLNQIANVQIEFVHPKIYRRNNAYVLTLQAWNNENVSANDLVLKFKSKLDSITGLNYELGGILEKSKKGNKSVTEKIPVAYGIILLILIAYFNDIIKPTIITFCALLALTGANFGLFFTNSDFGFITFLGYICLVGICTNNGVILACELNSYEKNHVIEVTKSRVEPILLTCLTTIGGMLPLWLKNDPMFSTLGISIIFGLLTSIMITLFFLPSIFIILNNKK